MLFKGSQKFPKFRSNQPHLYELLQFSAVFGSIFCIASFKRPNFQFRVNMRVSSFHPTPCQPMQFQRVQFQPFALSTYSKFNLLQFDNANKSNRKISLLLRIATFQSSMNKKFDFLNSRRWSNKRSQISFQSPYRASELTPSVPIRVKTAIVGSPSENYLDLLCDP